MSEPLARPTTRDPRRWLVLAVMSIGTLIVFLDGTLVNTALPNIATKLGATTSQLQWVVDSYILVLAGLLLLGGTIGDRFGRRRWMGVGLLFFFGGSVLGGLVQLRRHTYCRTRCPGLGCRSRVAGNAVDRHQRVRPRRAGQSNRHLDGCWRAWRRNGTGDRRLSR